VTDDASTTDVLLHALDLAALRKFDRAKQLLEPLDDPVAGRLFLLVCELELQQQVQKRTTDEVRHEIGNAIAIAQANVEGMADGMVTPTRERLEAIATSLRSTGALLDRLRHPVPAAEEIRFEVCDLQQLIEDSVEAIASFARSKRVEIIGDATGVQGATCHGDAAQLSQTIRAALGDGIRSTRPGGSITVSALREIETVHIVVRTSEDAVFAVKLPLA
jgi:signal transduction histidine kinase